MKKFLTFLLLSSCAFCFAESNSQPPYRAMPTQPRNQQACSHLSPAEQDFAGQLSGIHRQIFCNEFTAEQRAETLAILLSQKPKYRGMTPDDAVEIVVRNSRNETRQGQDPQMKQDASKKPSRSYRPPRSTRRNNSPCRSNMN